MRAVLNRICRAIGGRGVYSGKYVSVTKQIQIPRYRRAVSAVTDTLAALLTNSQYCRNVAYVHMQQNTQQDSRSLLSSVG
jgi:hypothetical protein